MYPDTVAYFRNFLTIVLLLFSSASYSQADKAEVPDTSALSRLLVGPEWKANLGYSLMNSATEGDTVTIRWLMENGADIDAKTLENITPIMFAVANNKIDAVKVLLEYDPELNFLSIFGETPLIIAVKNQNLEIAELLIRDSADVNMADKSGVTPLHYASVYGYYYLADMLLYYEAKIFLKSRDGITPLMAAVWAGYPDVADLLIQNGANPEDRDNFGFTPLLFAAQNGDTLMMDLLLKRRVDLYEYNSFKYNALDLSVKSNKPEAVKFLLRKGNKWADKESEAVDPYAVAVSYSRKEISDILRKNNIIKKEKFGFDQVSISLSSRLHFNDYYVGFGLFSKMPLYNAGIFGGCDFKPFYTRILYKQRENEFYQFHDKSSVVYAGLFKEFILDDNPLKGSFSVKASIAAAYTFGNKMKGTEISPESRIRINPLVGMNWNMNSLNLFGNIEYLGTDFYKVGPLWFRIGAAYNLYFTKVRAPGRIIKWY